jgi:predicted transcriptional regulator
MNFGSFYRDRIAIIIAILEIGRAEDGSTKTAIMYRANLSHDQMKEYVRILTESKFLCYNLDTRKFKTAEKGLMVIEAYKRIEDMLKTGQASHSRPLRARRRHVRRVTSLMKIM